MAHPQDQTKAQAQAPTPRLQMEEKSKKQPDYILTALYCLMYLELGWLIVMIWRSCH